MFTIPILETDQSIRKKERYAKRIVPHKKLIKSLDLYYKYKPNRN